MKLNGTDGKVKIGENTVAELNEWTMDDEVNPITGRSFGETLEQSDGGVRKITGTLKGYLDTTDVDAQGVIVAGAKLALDLFPSGDEAGDNFYQIAEVHIQKVGIGTSNDNYVSFDASFQVNTVPVFQTVQ